MRRKATVRPRLSSAGDVSVEFPSVSEVYEHGPEAAVEASSPASAVFACGGMRDQESTGGIIDEEESNGEAVNFECGSEVLVAFLSASEAYAHGREAAVEVPSASKFVLKASVIEHGREASVELPAVSEIFEDGHEVPVEADQETRATIERWFHKFSEKAPA